MTSTPEHGVILARNVMVPLRDGIRLATDIYFPAANGAPAAGRFPAILLRSPFKFASRSRH